MTPDAWILDTYLNSLSYFDLLTTGGRRGLEQSTRFGWGWEGGCGTKFYPVEVRGD